MALNLGLYTLFSVLLSVSALYNNCTGGVIVDDVCYIYFNDPETWAIADYNCNQLEGYIYEPRDSDMELLLEDFVNDRDVDSVWLGARQEVPEDSLWRWAPECPECATGASVCSYAQMDLVLVIDQSGSIRGDDFDYDFEDTPTDNWYKIKNFIVKIVDLLTIGTAGSLVGAVKFSNYAEKQFYLDQFTEKQALIDTILGLNYTGGNTNTSGGLLTAKGLFDAAHGDRPNVPNVVLVVTDGVSTWDADRTIPSAMSLHDEDILVYTVGVTEFVDQYELAQISSSPHEYLLNWFMIPEFFQLNSYHFANTVMSSVCQFIGATHPKQLLYGEYQALEPQGCYRDSSTSRDLYLELWISDVTPSKCTAACKLRDNGGNINYAGLQEGELCFCGDSFGSLGTDEGCTVTCQGDITKWCGGYSANFVYLLDGAYGAWGFNQPNNFESRENCGALSSSSYGREGNYASYQYAFVDDDCTDYNAYICDVPFRFCDAYLVEYGFYEARDGWCVFIGVQPDTWYGARKQCARRYGDLALIAGSDDHETYRKILQTGGYYGTFWVGLGKKLFPWTSGGYVARFSDFASGEPSTSMTECLSMDGSRGSMPYKWRESNCDNLKPYMCMIDMNNFRSVGNETIDSGILPPGAGASAGASTGGSDGGGWSSIEIAMLILAILIILAVIAGLAIYFYNKSAAGGQVTPHKIYDARPGAGEAEGGYLGTYDGGADVMYGGSMGGAQNTYDTKIDADQWKIKDPYFSRVHRNPFPSANHFKDRVELNDVEDDSPYTIEYDPVTKTTSSTSKLALFMIDHPTFWNNKKN